MQWVFLVLSSILSFRATGATFSNYPVIITSILSILSNAYYSKNFRHFLSLYATAYIVGTFAEAYGLRYGQFFGSYFYTIQQSGIFNVPLQVGLFWANFYYLSHMLANRLSKKYLLLLDASIMTGIDLLLDPVMVKLGAWKWQNGGVYFGIPFSNFVGWFFVTLLISIIVRKTLRVKIHDQNYFGLISLSIVVVYLVSKFISLSSS